MEYSKENAQPVPDAQIESFAALGSNLRIRGRLDDAEAIFSRLVAAYPGDFHGFAGLGTVALAKEPPDLPAAYECLALARVLNPRDRDTLANLALALLRQGRFDEAAEAFQQLYVLDLAGARTGSLETAENCLATLGHAAR